MSIVCTFIEFSYFLMMEWHASPKACYSSSLLELIAVTYIIAVIVAAVLWLPFVIKTVQCKFFILSKH